MPSGGPRRGGQSPPTTRGPLLEPTSGVRNTVSSVSSPSASSRTLESGPNAGEAVDRDWFEATLDRYSRKRGWGSDGRPTRATVERLGLAESVDDDSLLAEASDRGD
ncbi:aldehyde ferredoxin oxidoreductase C-terminal domain-containing protein [Haloterrigena salinisoli]|uniref:aldehyde ferredoxin oxidoreductase C-terminal domain-containing protein n=1 Tax=Haloterrigena salinisoli TaxID=3132747 RepID=UPI0030D586BF